MLLLLRTRVETTDPIQLKGTLLNFLHGNMFTNPNYLNVPFCKLSGTCDSRESFAIRAPIFIARQTDLPESFEFPIRANHPIRANRANRFARITPLSL